MGQMHEKTVEAFKRQPLKGKYKNRKSNDSSTSEQLSTSNRQKIWNMHLRLAVVSAGVNSSSTVH